MKKTPKSEKPSEMTTVRLDVPLKRAIRGLAQKDNRTLSNYISNVLKEHAREAGALQSQES